MLTRLIQYILRAVSALSVLAIGSVIAGPPIAQGIKQIAYKKPNRPVTEAIDIRAVQTALSAEKATPRVTDAADLYLAKTIRAGEPKPTTSPVQVPTARVHDGGAAPVSPPPAQKPVDVAVKPEPVAKPAPVKKPIVPKPVINLGKLAAILAFARAQIGERYVMGGAGPNVWDCSGLTMRAFQNVGIDIGGHGVNVQYQKARAKGYLVPWSQRKAGDLVFYGTPGNFSHVAISAGGNTIIEAANPARPVIERHYWGQPYGQVARFLR